jgi:colanic acid biosynthesis glycosyl transferase WcaI
MKIIIYGINYAPELTGIGKYTGEMASWLAKQGNEVTVVTAPPYYPEWAVHKSYRGKSWTKEYTDGVTVYRCPLYVPKNVTSLKRIIHEFSFVASIIPIWLLTFFQKKYDVVLCISPPFHLGLLPMLYAKLRGARFINHIQDLQVDAAKDLGMIKNESFLNLMFGIEKFIFDTGDFVSTISTGMQKKIRHKYIDEDKTFLFPNWVDENVIYPLPKEQSLRSEFGLSHDDKVILYSGNLGEKQGLEIIIEVASHFISRRDVHFIISGSGGGKDKLIKLAEDHGLDNIKFYPLQPYEKLSALLAMADIHLVLQKKSASDLVMPSKLTGILAAAGCALVTALPGTSLYHVIHRHQMGILVEPESVSALTRGIENALVMNLDTIRDNARQYAEKYLSKNGILAEFENRLRRMVGKKAAIPVPEKIPSKDKIPASPGSAVFPN